MAIELRNIPLSAPEPDARRFIDVLMGREGEGRVPLVEYLVDDLVRRADGLATGAAPGTIIIDCTTSAPSTMLTLAEDSPELAFVDSPL
ncbi:MAG: NAD(P)-binding domain-containing protein, partial [Anaerolineae bacterium]